MQMFLNCFKTVNIYLFNAHLLAFDVSSSDTSFGELHPLHLFSERLSRLCAEILARFKFVSNKIQKNINPKPKKIYRFTNSNFIQESNVNYKKKLWVKTTVICHINKPSEVSFNVSLIL